MHTNSCSLVKKNFLLLCYVTRIFFCFVNVRLQCCFCCHRWCFGCGCMSQSSFYGLFNPMKTKLTSYRFHGYFNLFKVNRCRNMLILHHYPLTFHGRVEFYLHFSAFIHIRRDIFICCYYQQLASSLVIPAAAPATVAAGCYFLYAKQRSKHERSNHARGKMLQFISVCQTQLVSYGNSLNKTNWLVCCVNNIFMLCKSISVHQYVCCWCVAVFLYQRMQFSLFAKHNTIFIAEDIVKSI